MIKTLIAVAALAGSCAPAPVHQTESVGAPAPPHVEIVIIDCSHLQLIGTGFPALSLVQGAFGSPPPASIQVDEMGNFTIELAHPRGDGDAIASARQDAIGFSLSQVILGCPPAGCP